MKKAAIMALLGSTLLPASAARADVFRDNTKAQLAQGPVQTAPPAERPYGQHSTPRNPQTAPPPSYYGERSGRPYGSYYTELRIAPLYGGSTFVYDGQALVGSIQGGAGTVYVPEGRVYGVVVTRGDQVVWQGQIMATPGTVALSFDQQGTPVVERVPPPPPGAGVYQRRPVSALEFRDTMASLSTMTDDTSRLDWLTSYLMGRPVTVNQTRDVLSQFSYEGSRLRALEILAPNIIDRENNSRLLGSFYNPVLRAHAAAMLGVR